MRSVFEKSAFTKDILGDLPFEFYLRSVVTVGDILKTFNVYARLYMQADAYFMHYMPYEGVVRALKEASKAPAWLAFVRRVVGTQEFYQLNKVTAGSGPLSEAAAVQLLLHVAKRLDAAERRKTAQEKAVEEAAEAAKTLMKELRDKFEEYTALIASAERAAGGMSFSRYGLSIWEFLQSPDEFRRKMRMLSNFFVFFRRALSETRGREAVRADVGALSSVEMMRELGQLPRALPGELAALRASRALGAVKIAARQIAVYQRRSGMRLAVFVDKSGSMAERLPTDNVEKIAVAAGVAYALHARFGAAVYFFDTELEEARDAADVLLRIKADGGTNIDPVLEKIAELGGRYHYVIISDGITEASEEALDKFRPYADRTKLILIPPSNDRFNWVQVLKERGSVHYVRSAAELVRAATA